MYIFTGKFDRARIPQNIASACYIGGNLTKLSYALVSEKSVHRMLTALQRAPVLAFARATVV